MCVCRFKLHNTKAVQGIVVWYTFCSHQHKGHVCNRKWNLHMRYRATNWCVCECVTSSLFRWLFSTIARPALTWNSMSVCMSVCLYACMYNVYECVHGSCACTLRKRGAQVCLRANEHMYIVVCRTNTSDTGRSPSSKDSFHIHLWTRTRLGTKLPARDHTLPLG